ncbi:MAG: hypothetical protein WCQ16_04210 [Verrucomicrobiae bacterium]
MENHPCRRGGIGRRARLKIVVSAVFAILLQVINHPQTSINKGSGGFFPVFVRVAGTRHGIAQKVAQGENDFCRVAAHTAGVGAQGLSNRDFQVGWRDDFS